MEIIARIHTGFKEKFGIPRQSNLVDKALGEIVFEPKFRNADALKGIEEYDYLWLIWQFSENVRDNFTPMVTPPRLGGKIKKGVFATRSSFRPNALGLSSVKLEKVIYDCKDGPVIIVSGVDMLDMTPIYDIKPYLAYVDSHPGARSGFGENFCDEEVKVVFADNVNRGFEKEDVIIDILKQDPRAAYNKQLDYVFGMTYGNLDIRFTAKEKEITIIDIVDTNNGDYKKIK